MDGTSRVTVQAVGFLHKKDLPGENPQAVPKEAYFGILDLLLETQKRKFHLQEGPALSPERSDRGVGRSRAPGLGETMHSLNENVTRCGRCEADPRTAGRMAVVSSSMRVLGMEDKDTRTRTKGLRCEICCHWTGQEGIQTG